jgi:hypothetical protein
VSRVGCGILAPWVRGLVTRGVEKARGRYGKEAPVVVIAH